jgi:hypothetical protein
MQTFFFLTRVIGLLTLNAAGKVYFLIRLMLTPANQNSCKTKHMSILCEKRPYSHNKRVGCFVKPGASFEVNTTSSGLVAKLTTWLWA